MTELADAPRPTATSAPPASGPATPAPRFLADVYEEASRCNKCSLCQAVCPAYRVNPVEWETARGRVSLIRDAIEGRLELRDLAEGPLNTCLTCNNCVAACAPAVDTAWIVSRARQELYDQEGHPKAQGPLLRTLASPGALRAAHRLGRLVETTGLAPLARATGFTRLLGTAGAVLDHAGPLSRRTAYRRAAEVPPPAEPVRGRLGFVMCCFQNIAAAEATEATLRVFAANGFEVVVPTLGCTGLPARTLGDRDAMISMGAAATERLRGLEVDEYIGDSSSCTQHVRDYGRQLAAEPRIVEDAAALGSRTWHASHLLAERGLTAPLGRLRWTVAIDEPCALPHGGPERRALPALLTQIPGLRLVELEEAAMCCGGAGTYFHAQPERSAAILARKMQCVVASGAEVLVTENISCLHQLREGARRHAPHVRVMHVFEVLAASIDHARRRQELSG